MSNEFDKKKHSLCIENREALELTGAIDVPSFNENDIYVVTDFGNIEIKGYDLKLEALDLDSGIVKICGKICAVIYNDQTKVKGIFKRMIS